MKRTAYIPRDMRFPEEFSDRPLHRVESDAGTYSSKEPPSLTVIAERRKKAGHLGRPRPKTYLLQPIVEAYNLVLSIGYGLVEANQLRKEDQNKWTKDALSGMPLKLQADTTYQDAFRSPLFIDWVSPKIYHSTGIVARVAGNFVIRSNTPAKTGGKEVPLKIVMDMGLLPENPPKSHSRLVSVLGMMSDDNEIIRWYCYGKPELVGNGDVCELHVTNLDYLFVKKKFKP